MYILGILKIDFLDGLQTGKTRMILNLRFQRAQLLLKWKRKKWCVDIMGVKY